MTFFQIIKEHIGAYIEYQDIQELRDGFVEELSDTIVIGFIVQKNMKKLRKNWLTVASLKQQLRNILVEKPKINSEPIKIEVKKIEKALTNFDI